MVDSGECGLSHTGHRQPRMWRTVMHVHECKRLAGHDGPHLCCDFEWSTLSGTRAAVSAPAATGRTREET